MHAYHPGDVAFTRLVRALGPYLGQLVIVGGWAHRLFTLLDEVPRPAFAPLMTLDADLAADTRLLPCGASLNDLLTAAGFRERFRGDFMPPVSRYELADSREGFYAEFLAPLRGSGRGAPTMTLQGVVAQRLRHVNLLLAAPWSVTLTEEAGFPVGAEEPIVPIANPVSFLAQKLLILDRRDPDKQAKDILYLHDTLQIVSPLQPRLKAVRPLIEAELPARTVRELHQRIETWFASVTDPVRGAAAIARGMQRPQPPSPAAIAAACRVGLRQVFLE